jgi:hypothetical protein
MARLAAIIDLPSPGPALVTMIVRSGASTEEKVTLERIMR